MRRPLTVAGRRVVLGSLILILALAGCGSSSSPAALSAPQGSSTDPAALASTGDSASSSGAILLSTAGATAAAGARVPGIPAFLAMPPGATVTGSAAGAHGSLLQVSISGTTGDSVAAVLAFYRRTLTAAGFSASDDAVMPTGSSGTAYGRGNGSELLVVAVVDHGPTRAFSVGGTVRTP